MKFIKKGLIFSPNGETSLMHTHALIPKVEYYKGNIFKIYFSSRDKENRGRVFSILYDVVEHKVLSLEEKPLLNLGGIGTFDEYGQFISSIVKTDSGEKYYYYVGFSRLNEILFDAAIGLAIEKDGKITKFNHPIRYRTEYDLCFSASPYVIFDEGIFKMWYLSCSRWEKNSSMKNGLKHYYNIKYTTSADGINWNCESTVAIDFKNEYEYAIGVPTIVKDGENDYKMWYCYRAQKNTDTYRIGYAESTDGKIWNRKDELMEHFDVSKSGFDSQMICYPAVFNHNNKRYMLYNGNYYGKDGFGIAVLDD